ncbi:asparaginase [Modestobacter marinus]|uniref:Asparaginase n=1 Tax=Modestobacter marinus TaxID=477641 RepID=A0A846LMQ5_9ACTN|nr:asparaginase [Modestobacter marinus]NIH67422.1 L-asparaginase II [Modestobacter marinus]GGL54738.1 asparaginase [Modestobacter marinus]
MGDQLSRWADEPVLVEVWRAGLGVDVLESVHRGALVVLGADGAPLLEVGDVARPVLPRSSNKPVQATTYLQAGWEPRHDRELAIAAASHNGEDEHRALAGELLAGAGLGPDDLGCPPALPQHERTRAEWLVAGRAPERLAMNCSGKHAAMLAACVAAGWPTAGYLDRDHPLQQAIEVRLGEAAGEPVAAVVVDGCGAPQHAISLTGLARGVLSLVQAEPGTPGRRVADAMRAHPWLVAGTGREDTELMQAVDGLLVKGGADGVHVAALPGAGAVALKLDDGGDRGRAPALAAGLRRLGVPAETLARWLVTPVSGGEGVVGEVRAAAVLG